MKGYMIKMIFSRQVRDLASETVKKFGTTENETGQQSYLWKTVNGPFINADKWLNYN